MAGWVALAAVAIAVTLVAHVVVRRKLRQRDRGGPP